MLRLLTELAGIAQRPDPAVDGFQFGAESAQRDGFVAVVGWMCGVRSL
jgi:hypothetical protein